MFFASTRSPARKVSLSQAIRDGIAPDGGLYVPERLPRLEPEDFNGAVTLADIGERLLAPFFTGDDLAEHLTEVVREAFDFPAPVKRILRADGRVSVLELFHGPTAAFKDFGARFLAACMARMPHERQRPLTILVATSGDTGGAVAAAFHRRPGVQVVILYPKGLVSPLQEQQLTCWGDNVRTLSVRGTFDDCQRLVKEAFADPVLRQALELSSANSINIGRLLPQAVYYAAASLDLRRAEGVAPSFIVPSGNLGNVVACTWARHLGLPIDEIVLAHNANRTVPEFLATGTWQPRPSVATLASAMDVGNPSNMERLRALHPDWTDLARQVRSHSVSDEQIRERIRTDWRQWGELWCPHTATAAQVYATLPEASRQAAHWVLVATAHPAKFSEIVQPLVDRSLPMPESLARLLALPSHREDLEPRLDDLRDYLLRPTPQ
jgi:threonine synthase